MTDDDITMLDIARGDGRKLIVRLTSYQGRAGLDVREWYLDGNEWRPGKGIRLRPSEVAQTASALDDALARIANSGRIVRRGA